MDRESEKPAAENASPSRLSARVSRRTLLRAGAGATPVLLTLTSNPVSASTAGCSVASSFVSVNTFKSRNPGSTVVCGGRNCEYWRDESGIRSQGGNCTNSILNNRCSWLMGSPSGCSYNSSKICDVIGQSIVTSGQLGVFQHLASLCLNVKKGYISAPNGITQLYLQGMWGQYMLNGKYSASGTIWNEAQIIAWARSMLGYSIL